MKKFLFFLLFPLIGFSQIEKKNLLVGGAMDFEFKQTKISGYNIKQTYFSLAPSVGYFAHKVVMIGAQPSLYYINNSGGSSYPNLGFSVGPFLREYVKLGSNIYFFGQQNIGIGMSRDFPTSKSIPYGRYTNIDFKIGPGLSFFVNKIVGIDVCIYYTGNLNKLQIISDRQVLSSSKFQLTNGMKFSVGFNFIVDRQMK